MPRALLFKKVINKVRRHEHPSPPLNMRTPRLYTYIVRTDDGAAPNPFGGVCSLTICKPKIRSSAKKGDWIVGVGSRNAPSGDLSGRMIYAMKVEEIVPLKDYDLRAPKDWKHKIPNIQSLDLASRLGDCIYDFSRGGKPVQRASVHGPLNIQTDLGGKNALVSKDFYYFGSRAIRLPANLIQICPVTQGHRSRKNEPYRAAFESWIRNLGLSSGQLYGWPDAILDWDIVARCGGCIDRAHDPDAEDDA